MAGDTICVLVPVYERGDSFKHKVYDTSKSQTYKRKKLLVCRNGVRNEAVDEFWRNDILYAIDDDDEPSAKMHSSASRISDEARCATEQTPDTDSATENYDSTGLPVDLPAEFLEDSANAAAQLAAEKASFTASLVELKRLASDMGEKCHAQMLEALRSDNTGKTLHIKSGKPINIFEAAAWPTAFVEFFYGDCAPNLQAPKNRRARAV